MNTEVLVIGGGLAGSTAAIRLASHGKHVVLVERERAAQHKVCGEFLSGEALRYLSPLQIDVTAFGAVPILAVRVARGDSLREAPLPFPAMSLTRRCLDEALLQRAEQAGVTVLRGCTVESLSKNGAPHSAELSGGQQIDAPAVFLATGKHDLRGNPRPPGKQHGMVAFKMYWHLTPAQSASLGNAVELVAYPGGYGGLQAVERAMANFCCLVQAQRLRALGGNWAALLRHICDASPHLRTRLQGAQPLLEKPLTISSLPYGFVRESSTGFWHLGDQAAVIPSFTGDGMALALHSAALASEMYLAGSSAAEFQRSFASQIRRQVGFATLVSKTLVAAPNAAMLLPKLWPGVLGLIARTTRVAQRHLLA